MSLIDIITAHKTFDEEERINKESFLQFLSSFDKGMQTTRENLIGHLTSSSWVVNKEKTKALFAYHNIYQRWAWLGGHADGDFDLLNVAIKEAQEEAGIKKVTPILNIPIDLSIQPVTAHIKKGKYIPSHLHFNVTYLLEADENEEISCRPEENSGVEWIKVEELIERANEKTVKSTYQRLLKKVELLKNS